MEVFLIMYSLRSFFMTILLFIGIILLIVNKYKKTKILMSIGIISIVLSSIILLNGCYDAFLRPEYEAIDMSKEELVDFAEYVIEDERFNDIKNFLPNNETETSETFIERLSAKRKESNYFYRYSCQLGCYVYEFENGEMAANHFQERVELANSSDIITMDNYSIYAPPIKNEATFFNLHEGDHSLKNIDIVILYDKYEIAFIEVTNGTPKIFEAAKLHKFFNEGTEL